MLANGEKQKYEIRMIDNGRVYKYDTIEVHQMIVENGCYKFQNDINTYTTESLKEIGITSDRAVADMKTPTFETIYYYPVNRFVIKKLH